MIDFNSNIGKQIFGDRIKDRRKEKGFGSQEEFSEALGVQRVTVSSWERGGNIPDLANLSKICSVLDVDLGYLCGEYDEATEILSLVCDKTNLSEKAVITLMSNKTVADFINELFDNGLENDVEGLFHWFNRIRQRVFQRRRIRELTSVRLAEEMQEFDPDDEWLTVKTIEKVSSLRRYAENHLASEKIAARNTTWGKETGEDSYDE